MKICYMFGGLCVMVGLAVVTQASESGRSRTASLSDRTPVITVEEVEERAEAREPVTPREEWTVEERLAEIERVVDHLQRAVDPYGRRDEMLLERRLRDLERKVEDLERELRRLRTEMRR